MVIVAPGQNMQNDECAVSPIHTMRNFSEKRNCNCTLHQQGAAGDKCKSIDGHLLLQQRTSSSTKEDQELNLVAEYHE